MSNLEWCQQQFRFKLTKSSESATVWAITQRQILRVQGMFANLLPKHLILGFNFTWRIIKFSQIAPLVWADRGVLCICTQQIWRRFRMGCHARLKKYCCGTWFRSRSVCLSDGIGSNCGCCGNFSGNKKASQNSTYHPNQDPLPSSGYNFQGQFHDLGQE